MANNNMELTRWGDGKVRLVYWDYFHGEDTVFVLDDGQAFRESYDDNMDPVREAVDLVQALEEFMQELESQSRI